MPLVYGDSTPFPHDVDFIALLEAGVDCAVELASAQDVIDSALQHIARLEEAERAEVRSLGALLERVRDACTASQGSSSERARRAASQALDLSRELVAEATTAASRQREEDALQARARMDEARRSCQRSVEQFLARQAPPRSSLGLRLSATLGGMEARVSIGTPFQLQAVFSVDVPASHAWSRPRRAGEIVPNVDVRLPQESGWLSRRVEMSLVRLDRYFVSDVQVSDAGGSLRLRKGATSGAGYEVRVPADQDAGAWVCPLDEDGTPDPQRSLTLDLSDAAGLVGLWRGIVESSADLYPLRKSMTSARFGTQALDSLDSPSELAQVLVQDMAPLTQEVSRRSGAPGELVLRRDAGPRRREEFYLTHTELLRRIFTLSEERRSVFAPLGLISDELGSIVPPVPAPSEPATSNRPEPPSRRHPTNPGVAVGPPLAPRGSAPPASSQAPPQEAASASHSSSSAQPPPRASQGPREPVRRSIPATRGPTVVVAESEPPPASSTSETPEQPPAHAGRALGTT